MNKNLQWKLVAIIGVVGLSGTCDLSTGRANKARTRSRRCVHLVLRVQTDDALQLESETDAEQLNEQLSLQGIEVASAVAVDPTTIRIEGVPPDRDAEYRQMAEDFLALNYDRETGAAGAYTYRMRAP